MCWLSLLGAQPGQSKPLVLADVAGKQPVLPPPAKASGIDDALLPAPGVEPDIVSILSQFPRQERSYLQLVLHTVKDLQTVASRCRLKMDKVDTAQAHLRAAAALESYLRVSHSRLAALPPPARFEKAHKTLLAYLQYAELNPDQEIAETGGQPHALVPLNEVALRRQRAFALYQAGGLNLSTFMSR